MIEKRYYSSVERASDILATAVVIFRVSLVFFTDTTRSAVDGRHPGQAQRAVLKIPKGPNIGKAEVVVISKWVEIEEITRVEVSRAKWVGKSAWALTGWGVIYADTLDCKFNVLDTVEISVLVDSGRRLDMLRDQGRNFFSSFCIIFPSRNNMFPQKGVRLNEEVTYLCAKTAKTIIDLLSFMKAVTTM